MRIESQVKLVSIDEILPNRFQPRLEFEDDALKDLAESIRTHGIIEPLVVRRVQGKFEIIAGERRYKAASKVGLKSVPAIVADLNDNDSAEVAIIENTHRRDMSPIEEAKAYKKLLDRKYVTQEQLSKRLGTSQSNIANKIRLLALDDTVQDALQKNRISERHARSLLRVTDKFKQVDLLNQIIDEKWTVKKLEDNINNLLGTYNNKDASGDIVSNNNDVNVDDIVNNSSDIKFDIPSDYTPNAKMYQYQNKVTKKSKKSLLFNDLEDESVNMDTSLGMDFNPFDRTVDTSKLDGLDNLDETDDAPTIKKDNNVFNEKIDSVESTISAIQKLKKLAEDNDIPLVLEEFDFDKMHQYIIRIDKDEK